MNMRRNILEIPFWQTTIILMALAVALTGCGTVIPGASPERCIDDPVIPPREISIVILLAPDDDPGSATVKLRFCVMVLPSLGSLLSLDLDPDGDGPLAAEAVDLHSMEAQDSYTADYNWWYFDYELQVSDEQFCMTFFFRCEQATREFPIWMQGVSHGYTPWPY